MNVVEQLRQNDGQYSLEDVIQYMGDYERAAASLRESKEHSLYFKVISRYWELYKEMVSTPIFSYRPGVDYIVSFNLLIEYAKTMEKGIPGIVEPNRDEMNGAYLAVLKRIYEGLTKKQVEQVISRANLLLECAYCDLNDNYSQALFYIGNYYGRKKEYKKAFRFYKKGAEFDADGRQISFPFFLIGRNQAKVGECYEYGRGVKKNLSKAKKYYALAADNCAYDVCPLLGRVYFKEGKWAKSFLALVGRPQRFPRYDVSFMVPRDRDELFKKIYDKLDKKKRTDEEQFVFAVMKAVGVVYEFDESYIWENDVPEKYLDKAKKFIKTWMDIYF